ncbi:MAG: rhombotarget lipoprotein [Burkholderiales bacterium]|jgi:rhombotail lipoprotein
MKISVFFADFRLVMALAVLAICAGCAGVQSRHTTTSVVDYLYPNENEPVAQVGTPVLNLPMTVGIAFVPDKPGQAPAKGLTENMKTDLLERVAAHFRKLDYIKSIEIIPSAYLTPRGGFENLNQIRTMYGVETIALVSYDQAQFTDESTASVLYWTIVGAYIVPAEKNSTSTMVDAVVMHIPSRKMLFRAPGVSQVKGLSTPVNLSEELRVDSEKGFNEAVDKMIVNLDSQLVAFQEKVKESPEEYTVVQSGKTSGGGAVGVWSATLVTLLLVGGVWWSHRIS